MILETSMHLLMPVSETLHVRGFLLGIENWLKSLGIVPELAAISAPGISRRPFQFERARKRLQEEDVEQARHGSLFTRRLGSESFQDTVFNASFGVGKDSVVGVSHDLRVITAAQWMALAVALRPSLPFVYGYVYTMPEARGPFWYATGTGYDNILGPNNNKVENRMLEKWGRALRLDAGPRNVLIRQVYSLQLLSDAHLALRVGVKSLREWIEASKENGKLESMVPGIWAWCLDGARNVRAANEALSAVGLLAAWDPQANEVL